MSDPRRIYRLLLKLYPARFREEYSTPMERQFWDDYGELSGFRQRLWFWMCVTADLCLSIPAEILREVRQDLSYAVRVYRRRRLITLFATVALALAIGAATGVFSVVNAVLLRSLPFREPDRLVEVRGAPVNLIAGRAAFNDWRSQNRYLEDAAGYRTAKVNLALSSTTLQVQLAEVSANFFTTLGTPPEIGRDFRPDEDATGANGVAILSYAAWQQAFGGDSTVLGTTIRVNGVALMVIGIEPRGVEYPAGAGIWTPTAFDFERIPKYGAFGVLSVARLKAGLTAEAAASMFEADLAARGKTSRYKGDLQPALVPLRQELAGQIRQASLVLLGAVGFVLLIACANVAHLLLARITERREEFATRAALGASRARLVQQLITESIVLTLSAAVAGLGVAYAAAKLAASALPAQLAVQAYTVLDWRVLGFAMALALLTGVLFGVVPATLMAHMQPQADTVRNRGGAGWGVSRLRAPLVALQTALTIVLLAGCLEMGRTFQRLVGTGLGYDTKQVATLSASLTGSTQHTTGAYIRTALTNLRSIPGVEFAAATNYLPLETQSMMGATLELDSGHKIPPALLVSVTPEYFQSIGTQILEGRGFTAADRYSGQQTAIVNTALARSIGGTHVLGTKLVIKFPVDTQLTVVGVVQNLRMHGPADGELPELFRPMAQVPAQSLTFTARVRGQADQYLAVCREALRRVDSSVAIYSVETLQQKLDRNLARPRFYTTAVLFFGCFSLFLAVIAIYSVAAHSIAQRKHEIGVRAALGAAPESIRLRLLREGAVPVMAGGLAGVAGSMTLGRVAEHLISTAHPMGLWMCAGAAALMTVIALLAIWMATRRVIKLDPMTVLRAE